MTKNKSFIDTMIKIVFISTFILAVATITIAWFKDWEQLLITLTERWFTIMVGELIVVGAIQVAKIFKTDREDEKDGN